MQPDVPRQFAGLFMFAWDDAELLLGEEAARCTNLGISLFRVSSSSVGRVRRLEQQGQQASHPHLLCKYEARRAATSLNPWLCALDLAAEKLARTVLALASCWRELTNHGKYGHNNGS